MTKKTTFLQKFWLPIILALIALAGTILPIVLADRSSSPSTPFTYQVRVENRSGDPIENATVRLEIGAGKAPLDGISDTNGLARIFIEASYLEKPARLIVEAVGYKTHKQEIDLPKDDLPKVVQLDLAP